MITRLVDHSHTGNAAIVISRMKSSSICKKINLAVKVVESRLSGNLKGRTFRNLKLDTLIT